MMASAPSNTAVATSETSARVGTGDEIIDSSICVATTTGLPIRRSTVALSSCRRKQTSCCRWPNFCFLVTLSLAPFGGRAATMLAWEARPHRERRMRIRFTRFVKLRPQRIDAGAWRTVTTPPAIGHAAIKRHCRGEDAVDASNDRRCSSKRRRCWRRAGYILTMARGSACDRG
jgi:hypothetical protein